MSGDPYREDLAELRARLKALGEEHAALLTQIRGASIALDRRYRAARVAERQVMKVHPAVFVIVPAWAVGASIALVANFGAGIIPCLLAAAIGAVVFSLRALTRPLPERQFDPTRYEQATAPAHLLAEHKWLDRDQEEADALDQEIDETRAFLEAQEKHDAR